MHTFQSIAVSTLLVDSENPRIEANPDNPKEAIQAVVANQKEKLIVLAKDIVDYGLNPAESPIVMPNEADKDFYVVLEGNRRVTALKVLMAPDLMDGVVENTLLRRIKTLSEEYQKAPISHISCVVVESRDEANHWIELRHIGEKEGAGIVRWGGEEAARFRRRSGQKEPALQILDYLVQRGDIDQETRKKVPVTSLGRLISTPYVRNRLGIELRSGSVDTLFDHDAVAKGLTYVVNDLASGRTATKNIYHKDDRIRYINGLPATDLPDTSNPEDEFKPLVAPTPATDPVTASPTVATSASIKRNTPTQKNRSNLVPRGCRLTIGITRINEIYHELRKLEIETYTNAVSVLFRVFLELSVDAYNSKYKAGFSEKDSLNAKVLAVSRHLGTRNMLDSKQAIAVERACEKDNFLAANICTMHQYVHNPHFSPAPSDLLAAWDNLSLFIEAIWS